MPLASRLSMLLAGLLVLGPCAPAPAAPPPAAPPPASAVGAPTSGAPSAAAAPTAVPAEPLGPRLAQRTTVKVGLIPTVGTTAMFVALDKGYFAEENVDFEWEP